MEKHENERPIVCYCSNAIPPAMDGPVARRLDRVFKVFSSVRDRLELDENTPLPLGLWLDADAADRLANNQEELASLSQLLRQNQLAIATLNAFPYGQFHGARVKEQVYIPDWRSPIRLKYTMDCAKSLAELPCAGKDPWSISTLPGGYRRLFENAEIAEMEIAGNLRRAAADLENLQDQFGVDITVAVEMEPDCLWETPAEFAEFHNRYLAEDEVAAKRIGVCYDTCHQELIEGAPGSGLEFLLARGVPVHKIQLSAALCAAFFDDSDSLRVLASNLAGFAEDTYLHQTRIFNRDGDMVAAFSDIPSCSEIFTASANAGKGGRAVAHFHMPLYLDATKNGLFVLKEEAEAVLSVLRARQDYPTCVEIETYTYSAMPKVADINEMENSIAREISWTLEKINRTPKSI